MTMDSLGAARDVVLRSRQLAEELPGCRRCGCNWPKSQVVDGLCPNCRVAKPGSEHSMTPGQLAARIKEAIADEMGNAAVFPERPMTADEFDRIWERLVEIFKQARKQAA